jgi:uncharacterized protein YndB with AHSA1/START domain
MSDDTHREVGGDPRTLLIRRRYAAAPEDVWSACTEPERLRRFFVPVSGDLRPGGHFQLQGNAGGEILRCEPPRLLRMTWAYGEAPPSQVELRLTPDGEDATVLELRHSPVAEHIEIDPVLNDAESGLWGMGTGWELGLIGLERHLRGESPALEAAAAGGPPPEILELAERCGEAWAAVVGG